MLERLGHLVGAWGPRLLHLNTEIVEADASLAAALRGFFERSDAGSEVTEISGQIVADLTRFTLLRRL
jgi:hypothetical protein